MFAFVFVFMKFCFILISLSLLLFFRDFLKLFKTDELMEWKNLTSICEKEFRDGLPDSPATGVFDRNTESGNKRWEDFKKRVVEHVSINTVCMIRLLYIICKC